MVAEEYPIKCLLSLDNLPNGEDSHSKIHTKMFIIYVSPKDKLRVDSSFYRRTLRAEGTRRVNRSWGDTYGVIFRGGRGRGDNAVARRGR